MTRANRISASLAWDRPNQTFVRKVDGRPGEYWADVSFEHYRASFLEFFGSTYSVPVGSIPGTLHVDHVVNRGFVRTTGLRFARLALVPSRINTSYGSRIERGLTRIDKAGRKVVLMDYLVAMKVLGIRPPAGRDDYQRRRAEIARAIAAGGAGIDQQHILSGMDGLFTLWDVL